MEWNKTGTWRAQRPYYADKTAPCHAACPAGTDIVSFVQRMKEGDFEGAWSVIMEENPFPGICGRVCFHPCESRCNRGSFDEPVAIHALERLAADFSARLPHPVKSPRVKRKEKVAVIGSGPAGMSCAYHLTRLNYPVTVFESLPFTGGMLRVGIPSYRLPKNIVDREISQIEAMGVEIRKNTPVGIELRVEDLQDYPAIFIATGAPLSRKLHVPGEDAKGVMAGLDFLKRFNLKRKVQLGERIAIVGGGNTAMDAARAAIRLGKKALILYRRSREEMPAFEEEIAEALEEDVEMRYLVNPIRIQWTGRRRGLECLRMELGEKDETGRRKPVAIPGSNHFIRADHIVIAAGEEIETSLLPRGIGTKEGIVFTQRGGWSGRDGIFAGGDVASTERTVAHAIGSGKRTAIAIDCYLRGKECEEIFRKVLIGSGPSVSMHSYHHPEKPSRNPHIVAFEELNTDYFENSERRKEGKLGLAGRLKRDREVTSGLCVQSGIEESGRCFSCGTCDECENCYTFCPDASILKTGEKLSHQVDYDFCKGCGICFTECPRGVISLEEEAK
jgi:NADPH-dependent glutamate synthase beta subunit-like oxidoreductase/Pyruvate/2-oxoacid:ferredoxin oxidoreductase delta subunit